jgi:hypothetical protein
VLHPAGVARLTAPLQHPLLLMQHGVDGRLIHKPQRQRDSRDALPNRLSLLRLRAARRLLAREQLKLDCNLAEEPILRVHPSPVYVKVSSFLKPARARRSVEV